MSGPWAPGPQSGGREPAPGRLALVQNLVNSHFDLVHDRGADLLATPAGLDRWLVERDLGGGRVTSGDLARVLAAREGLRARLAVHNGEREDLDAEARLRAAADGLVAAFALEPGGATAPVAARPGVAGALGLVLAVVHEAQVAGTWPRLKACPGHDCGWAFYDTSRNGASRWCSMAVCGGREKARAYRRRER